MNSSAENTDSSRKISAGSGDAGRVTGSTRNAADKTGTAGKTAGRKSIRTIAFIGMFGGIAAILMFLEFPIPFIAPAFYQLDFSEVPVLIGAFSLGPVAGIAIELIKVLVHLLLKGSSTAGIGDLANFIIGCSLVVPASILYRLHKTRKEAVIGMTVGVICMTVAGSLLNAFVLLPMYAAAFGGMDAILAAGAAVNGRVNSVLGFAAILVAPFNFIKGALTSVITYLLYKRISRLVRKAGA